MITFTTKNSFYVTFCTTTALLLAFSGETAFGQICNCPPNMCLSQWGFCGTSDAYCGEGCQCGPCTGTEGETTCNCPANMCLSKWGFCGTGDDYCGEGCQCGSCQEVTRNISVADVVTEAFFNGIVNSATDPNCPGKNFYSRKTFLQSIDPFPRFASGSEDVARREIAALFAHFTQETGSLCYIEEHNGPSLNYCDPTFTQYPCAPGKGYFGRGPIQLSWNYNYGAAGQSIGFDGLNDPDIVARDPVISFETALWFWMNNNCHNAITSGQGFGATIRCINSMECNGGNPAAVNNRVQYFTNYCSQFGVDPGDNLYC